MNKIAELAREAEIRGAMAAFVDAGLVKVASQNDFEALVGAVCNYLGEEEYDLQKVAAVTDAVLTGNVGGPQYAGREKIAAERDEFAHNAALGELLQMKIAGQIDDATFQKTAGALMDGARYATKRIGALFGRKPTTNFSSTAEDIYDARRVAQMPTLADMVRNTGARVKKTYNTGKKMVGDRVSKMSPNQLALGAGVLGATGAAGTTMLGQHLYDKYYGA